MLQQTKFEWVKGIKIARQNGRAHAELPFGKSKENPTPIYDGDDGDTELMIPRFLRS